MLLRDNIYETLRSEVLSCRLAPGEEIREQELAARFTVSRQPVRDALLRLEQDHLVTVSARQGYRVNPIAMADAAELFQFRLVVEPACVLYAAEAASDETLQHLDQFRLADKAQDFIGYNRAFHCALARASNNQRMARTACELIEQADRLVRISLGSIKGRDPGQLVAEHIEIIDALQSRDGRKAKRLACDHISRAEKRVLSALRKSAVILTK